MELRFDTRQHGRDHLSLHVKLVLCVPQRQRHRKQQTLWPLPSGCCRSGGGGGRQCSNSACLLTRGGCRAGRLRCSYQLPKQPRDSVLINTFCLSKTAQLLHILQAEKRVATGALAAATRPAYLLHPALHCARHDKVNDCIDIGLVLRDCVSGTFATQR